MEGKRNGKWRRMMRKEEKMKNGIGREEGMKGREEEKVEEEGEERGNGVGGGGGIGEG